MKILQNKTKCERQQQGRKRPLLRTRLKNFKYHNKRGQRGAVIKGGMEVGLTSPNSDQLVALGTIQPLQNQSMGLDGQPLFGFVEVLINIVFKSTTSLPRPQGRVTKMGSTQALCIPWPCKNVTNPDETPLQTKVSIFINETMAKRSANSQAMTTRASELKTAGEKKRKKRETSNVVMNEVAEEEHS